MSLTTLQAPGQITYQVITCPTCGATLRVGYQALAPESLIADARCPVCGTVVAHDVVDIDLLASPYYPAQVTDTWMGMFSAMMPMLMMIMMMAIMMPMMKGVTAS